MTIAATVVRVLLGVLFTVAGVTAFVFTTPPPMAGTAGAFNALFVHSHWSMFVGAAQLVAGVLLLANRFVMVALVVLGGFLYNSLAFHLTMMPSVLPLPIIVLLLWLFLCWTHRREFAVLFASVHRD